MSYADILTALAIWREARNQPLAAQQGVWWVIHNRTLLPAWWNGNHANDPVAVILMPYQFSSFNSGDPNATKLPSSTDAVFESILGWVTTPNTDPTNGANSYYSTDIAAPSWAAEAEFTVQLGELKFYKT